MKYPASKHYEHLDLNEPIPEIELRYDEYHLYSIKAFFRWAPWCATVVLGLYLFVFVFQPGHIPELVLMFLAMLVWLGPVFPIYIRRRQSGITKDPSALDPWGIPLGVQIRYQSYYIIMMILVMQIPSADQGFSGLILMFGISGIAFGIGLIFVSRMFRQPGQISCEACSYSLVGLQLPGQCPECGHALLDLSYATDRPRIRDARFLGAGVVIALLGFALSTLLFVSPTTLYASLPKAALLPLAARDRDAFDQIMKQPLSAAEEQQLLDAMIDMSTTGSYRSSHAQGQWIEAKVFAGKLSDQQLDTLFMPTTAIEIDAPGTARVGQPVVLRLKAEYVRMPSFSTTPGYYFRGFVVDGSAEPLAGSDRPRFRLYLTEMSFRNEKDVPVVTWTPTAAGEATIAARVVLALFPAGGTAAAVQIDWSSPEDAMFPTAPVWAHVLDLEHTITVVE